MDANSAYPVKKPSFLGSPASSRRLGYGPGYSERISVADTDRAHQGRGAKRGPRRYQPPPQAHGAASGPAGPLRARGEREERDTSDSERERDWAAPHMERVRVTVRIRPPLKALREHPGAVEVMGDARTIRVHRYLSARSQVRYTDMSFDSILGPGTTQEEVYNAAARAVVEDVVRGYNGTVMAYGQTGAGKTYTVGNMLSTSGIIPRAASELLQIRDTDEEHDYTLYMSYVQIYCEQVQDLIRPTSDNLPLREDETGQVVLPGVHEVEIQGIQMSGRDHAHPWGDGRQLENMCCLLRGSNAPSWSVTFRCLGMPGAALGCSSVRYCFGVPHCRVLLWGLGDHKPRALLGLPGAGTEPSTRPFGSCTSVCRCCRWENATGRTRSRGSTLRARGRTPW